VERRTRQVGERAARVQLPDPVHHVHEVHLALPVHHDAGAGVGKHRRREESGRGNDQKCGAHVASLEGRRCEKGFTR
jgi:hypothetical protein